MNPRRFYLGVHMKESHLISAIVSFRHPSRRVQFIRDEKRAAGFPDAHGRHLARKELMAPNRSFALGVEPFLVPCPKGRSAPACLSQQISEAGVASRELVNGFSPSAGIAGHAGIIRGRGTSPGTAAVSIPSSGKKEEA